MKYPVLFTIASLMMYHIAVGKTALSASDPASDGQLKVEKVFNEYGIDPELFSVQADLYIQYAPELEALYVAAEALSFEKSLASKEALIKAKQFSSEITGQIDFIIIATYVQKKDFDYPNQILGGYISRTSQDVIEIYDSGKNLILRLVTSEKLTYGGVDHVISNSLGFGIPVSGTADQVIDYQISKSLSELSQNAQTTRGIDYDAAFRLSDAKTSAAFDFDGKNLAAAKTCTHPQFWISCQNCGTNGASIFCNYCSGVEGCLTYLSVPCPHPNTWGCCNCGGNGASCGCSWENTHPE